MNLEKKIINWSLYDSETELENFLEEKLKLELIYIYIWYIIMWEG